MNNFFHRKTIVTASLLFLIQTGVFLGMIIFTQVLNLFFKRGANLGLILSIASLYFGAKGYAFYRSKKHSDFWNDLSLKKVAIWSSILHIILQGILLAIVYFTGMLRQILEQSGLQEAATVSQRYLQVVMLVSLAIVFGLSFLCSWLGIKSGIKLLVKS